MTMLSASCCRPWNAVKKLKATPAHLVGHSMARTSRSRWQWNNPTRAQPCSRRAANPPSPLPDVRGRKPQAVMDEASHRATRKALESGNMEDALRHSSTAYRAGSFDNLPQPERTQLVEKQAPALGLHLTETSALNAGARLRGSGAVEAPDAPGHGRAKPPDVPADQRRTRTVSQGESQVMVPDAGHGMQRDNAASTMRLLRPSCSGASSGRTVRTRDPKRAAADPVAAVGESARTVRQDPTANLEAARRPGLFTLPFTDEDQV